ncbi:erg26, C-3 sterol dehydrogenase [Tilletia horrida]|nr:erg26, C-3 sterol dehydrogenase [Tilletia horrida]
MVPSILSRRANPQSWATFKKDIYRPRIALFLLALLLASSTSLNPKQAGPKDASAATNSQHKSDILVDQHQQQPLSEETASLLSGLSYHLSDILLFRPDRVLRRTAQHLFTSQDGSEQKLYGRSSASVLKSSSVSEASPQQSSPARPTPPAQFSGSRDKAGRRIPSQPRPPPARPSEQRLENPFKVDVPARPLSRSFATSSPTPSVGSQLRTISKPALRAAGDGSRGGRSYGSESRDAGSDAGAHFSVKGLKTFLLDTLRDLVTSAQSGLHAIGLGSLTHPNVLPFLILFHIVLLARFGGMLLDDAIGQELFALAQHSGTLQDISMRSRKSTHLLRTVFFQMVLVIAVAFCASSSFALVGLKEQARRVYDMSASQYRPNAKTPVSGGLLPARTILLLETVSTMISLSLPLYRLLPLLNSQDMTTGSNRWSRLTVTLPSPSHSPPISELLHIPDWLCALVDPRAARMQVQARERARLRGPNQQRAPNAGTSAASSAMPDALAQATLLGVPRRRLNRAPLGLPTPAAPEQMAAPSDASASETRTGFGLQNPLTLSTLAELRRSNASSEGENASSSISEPNAPGSSPSANASTPANPTVTSKSLRLAEQTVCVSLGWFLEAAVSFWDRCTGVAIYGMIVINLPSLTPTSICPLVALLALRGELAQLVMCWTSARQTVECLEFVRRRWGVTSAHRFRRGSSESKDEMSSADFVYRAVWNGEEQTCSMCFEQTPAARSIKRPAGSGEASSSPESGDETDLHQEDDEALENTCILDCAHVLHADCLTKWLQTQNFCPQGLYLEQRPCELQPVIDKVAKGGVARILTLILITNYEYYEDTVNSEDRMATSPASGAYHFVVGGAGFLGSSIVRLLLARGEKHVAIFDLREGSSPTPAGVITYIPGDLTSESSLTDALTSFAGAKGAANTVIYHTASPLASLTYADAAALYEKVNVKGTRNVVEVARKLKVRKLVFTSSASVVFDGRPVINGDERLPYPSPMIDHYNETKSRAEALVCLASGSPSDPEALLTVALRPAGIFGPNDRQMIPGFLEVFRTRRTGFQIGNNENVFDWTYVDNVAHAHLLAADKLDAPPLLSRSGADGIRELGTVHLPDPILGEDEKKSARARGVPTSESRGPPPAPARDYAKELPSTLSADTLSGNLDVRPVIRNRFDQFWGYVQVEPTSESEKSIVDEEANSALAVAGNAFFITNGAPIPFFDVARALWYGYYNYTTEKGLLTPEQQKKYAPVPPSKATVLPVSLALVLGTLAEAFGKLTGRQSNFTRFKVAVSSTTRYHNIEKARRVLGYEPLVGMEEAVKRSVEWWASEHPPKEWLK